MGEDRKTFKIKDGNLGEVKIADEVVAIIAGLALNTLVFSKCSRW